MSGGEFHDEWCPLNGCRCGNCGPCAQMPECPASPPAVAASTGTSEDVEALAKVLVDLPTHPEHYAQLILASDWLAAHDAATADRVRRETAEGIAQAIDEMKSFAHGNNPISEAHLIGYGTARRVAARIAREQAR